MRKDTAVEMIITIIILAILALIFIIVIANNEAYGWAAFTTLIAVILLGMLGSGVKKMPPGYVIVIVNEWSGNFLPEPLDAGYQWLWPWERVYAMIQNHTMQLDDSKLKVGGTRHQTSDDKGFIVSNLSAKIDLGLATTSHHFVHHFTHFLHPDKKNPSRIILEAPHLYEGIDEIVLEAISTVIGQHTEAEIISFKKQKGGIAKALGSELRSEVENLLHGKHLPLSVIGSIIFTLDQPKSVEIGVETIRSQKIEAEAKYAFKAQHIADSGGRALLALYIAYSADVDAEVAAAKTAGRPADKTLLRDLQIEIAQVVADLKPFEEAAEKAWREHKGHTRENKTETVWNFPQEVLLAAQKIFGKP